MYLYLYFNFCTSFNILFLLACAKQGAVVRVRIGQYILYILYTCKKYISIVFKNSYTHIYRNIKSCQLYKGTLRLKSYFTSGHQTDIILLTKICFFLPTNKIDVSGFIMHGGCSSLLLLPIHITSPAQAGS